MYVLSASNRRVSIQLLGKNAVLEKLSRLEELLIASLSFMGISSAGHSNEIGASGLSIIAHSAIRFRFMFYDLDCICVCCRFEGA